MNDRVAIVRRVYLAFAAATMLALGLINVPTKSILADTSMPPLIPPRSALSVITAANANQIQQLAQIGNGTVETLAWSPDGKLIAVGGSLGVRLYQVGAWQIAPRVLAHVAVEHIAFSPDSSIVAGGDLDSQTRLWDITTGQQRLILQGAEPSFSGDGKLIATGSRTTVWLWNAESGQQIRSIEIDGTVRIVRLSLDGNILAVGSSLSPFSYSVFVSLWNTHTGDALPDLAPQHTDQRTISQLDEAFDLALSPDGKMLGAAGWGGVALWNIPTNAPIALNQDQLDPAKRNLVFSPDHTRLAVGDDNGKVTIWNILTGAEDGEFYDDDQIVALAFDPTGAELASASTSGLVHIWDVKSGEAYMSSVVQPLLTLVGYADHTDALAFNASETQLIGVNVNGTAWKWDLRTSKQIGVQFGAQYFVGYGTLPFARSIAISANAGLVASGITDSGEVDLWTPTTGAIRGALTTKEGDDVYSVAISQDTQMLAAATNEMLYLWDLQTVTRAGEFYGGVSSLAFGPGGSLAIGLQNSSGYVLDTRTGRHMQELSQCHPNQADILESFPVVAFSPDGRAIALALNASLNSNGSNLDDICLWDARTGKQRAILNDFTSDVEALAFNSDGSLMISGNTDGLQLWASADGSWIATFAAPVSSLAFSRDGKLMATAGDDGVVRVWGVKKSG